MTQRIKRAYVRHVNTANDANERTELACGFISAHFLLFFSPRLIGFTFDALWSRVFKPKWKQFRTRSDRRIVPLTSTSRKKPLWIGQAADFSELNRHTGITVFSCLYLPFTPKRTSSSAFRFPYLDNLLRSRIYRWYSANNVSIGSIGKRQEIDTFFTSF